MRAERYRMGRWRALGEAVRDKIGARFPSRLRCSFCGRPAAQVKRLVAGASGYICDGCVAKCVKVLYEHGGCNPVGDTHI